MSERMQQLWDKYRRLTDLGNKTEDEFQLASMHYYDIPSDDRELPAAWPFREALIKLRGIREMVSTEIMSTAYGIVLKLVKGNSVTLCFKSVEDKNEFMGGLCDGWGEEHCSLHWPWEEGVKFAEAIVFDVEVIMEEREDWQDYDE